MLNYSHITSSEQGSTVCGMSMSKRASLHIGRVDGVLTAILNLANQKVKRMGNYSVMAEHEGIG